MTNGFNQLDEDESPPCDQNLLNEMFRSAHSLKGLSAMLGFGNIMDLTHNVENIFDAARNDQLAISDEIVELIFQAIDRLTAMVGNAKDKIPDEIDCQSVLEGIQQALQRAGLERKQATQEEAEQAMVSLQQDENSKDKGVEESTHPQASPSELAEVEGAASREPKSPQTKSGEDVPSSSKRQTSTTDAAGSASPVETLRVDVERLDRLINLSGELVTNKARFAQITDDLNRLTAANMAAPLLKSVLGTLRRLTGDIDGLNGKSSNRSEVENIRRGVGRIRDELETVRRAVNQLAKVRTSANELSEAVHELERVSNSIQTSLMNTRMVPIKPLFTRFKRVIRDITRNNGKDIRLVIHGEKTELDKRMIDELGDPLIHMVRNSADHGIESADVREKAGKSGQGTVTLDAFHRGNSIVIQVTDDGKGLDGEKIRSKAIQKGLISKADAEKLTVHQVYQLVWEPGLSTAEKVTEVSGRGMGMDIVRSKIETLNGAVELDSTLGEGTVFTIKLPLTLAILPSLMAEIDGEVFAIPIESVVEIISVDSCDMTTVHGLSTARVRGRAVSVVRLSELFTWKRASTTTATEGSDKTTLVIVNSAGQEIALVVHRLLGEEDVVIKSTAENFRNIEGVSGACVRGDGRVSLILDVGTLVEMASCRAN